MSETTEVWVSAAQPSTATAAPIASTRPGRVIAWRERPPRQAARARADARARARHARDHRERAEQLPGPTPGGAQRLARAPRRRGALRPGRPTRARAAKPAVRAHRNASAMPATSRTPNPRTMGTGESSSTRKPTAVAIPAVAMVGPPAAAARTAACRGSPSAPGLSSSQRECSWIA